MKRLRLVPLFLIAMLALSACGAAESTPTATTAPAAVEPTNTTAMAAETPTEAAASAMDTPTAAASDATKGPAADTSMAAIKQRGKLNAGVKYDVRIFGYLNPETNKVEGFDVDLAKAVAERIFGSPDAVEFQEAISRNRIPYLDEGKVDVVFSTMTANEERSKQIDFSDTYYVAGQSLLVPVDSTIASVDDLAGKRVGTAKGSTSETNIRGFAPEATIELFDGYAAAVAAMDAGRLDAVTTDDIILYGFARDSPDKFKVVGGQFTQEPYAAGVKKGNAELLAEVNATLQELKQDGTWAELYKKWIGTDPDAVPPPDWRDVYKTAPAIPTTVAPTATP